MNQETKNCQNCKQDFVIEPEDFEFYTKIQVPPPTFCPECRLQRRLVFRNERTMYRNVCSLCHKDILSVYAKDKPFLVYCVECHYSDKWDPSDYGVHLDFSRPFLEQFRELENCVPRVAFYQINTVNCSYSNYVEGSKNAYLSYSTLDSEDVYYSKNVDRSSGIFDCFDVSECEYCCENILCNKNYNCRYAQTSRSCINCAFVYDCVNCRNCFLSSNLRNKEYCVLNKQYSKSDYEAEMKKMDTSSFTKLQSLLKQFQELKVNSLHKYANIVSSIDCTGDDLHDSKNAKSAFSAYSLENVAHVFRSLNCKDVRDVANCANNELIYEFVSGGGSQSRMVKCVTNGSAGLSEVEYSDFVASSSYLFGCVALRGKQYCILNKQYDELTYRELRKKIIAHMNAKPFIDSRGREYRYGEFFPVEFSPFVYNDTIAQEYFPLTESEASDAGYAWQGEGEKQHKITIEAGSLPDHIKDVPDSILNETIRCAHAGSGNNPCAHQCTKAFKIIPQELAMYRKYTLPLPRLCPNCRHYARLAERNSLKLWKRKCGCDPKKNTVPHQHGLNPCSNEFMTTYAPDRPELVYCEACYLNEVQ